MKTLADSMLLGQSKIFKPEKSKPLLIYLREVSNTISSINSTAAGKMSLPLPSDHFPERNHSDATAERS